MEWDRLQHSLGFSYLLPLHLSASNQCQSSVGHHVCDRQSRPGTLQLQHRMLCFDGGSGDSYKPLGMLLTMYPVNAMVSACKVLVEHNKSIDNIFIINKSFLPPPIILLVLLLLDPAAVLLRLLL